MVAPLLLLLLFFLVRFSLTGGFMEVYCESESARARRGDRGVLCAVGVDRASATDHGQRGGVQLVRPVLGRGCSHARWCGTSGVVRQRVNCAGSAVAVHRQGLLSSFGGMAVGGERVFRRLRDGADAGSSTPRC